MTTYGQSSSSSGPLTAEERAIAEYFADAECERKRPRNHAAYRATVLARKATELIAARGIVTTVSDYRSPRVIIDTAAVDDFVPIDPLLARQSWRAGIDAGRAERAELLAKMVAEQNQDVRW